MKKIVNAEIISGFEKFSNCGITIDDNGLIQEIFNMRRYVSESGVESFDASGAIVTPGLIDTHLHGFAGFGTEDKSKDSILGMSENLIKQGVTSFIPTLYPDEESAFFKAQDAISDAMGHEKGSRILGMNLEGPFINPKRCGALPVSAMSEVDIDYFDRIVKNGRGNIVCMTVAPELKHMRSLALKARAEGIVLLSGHTDATYENMIEGMQCGILHSTHFFNAMSRLHHRNPGAVGAILIQRDMCCEIIADGVHVHPELVKMLIRDKPSDNIVLVTDCLKPTMQKEGPFIANGVEVVPGPYGGFVSKNDPDLFNGSSLTLNKGVSNLISWDVDLQSAVKMATENPARIYNFNKIGSLVPGKLADIVIFEKDFTPRNVFVGGSKLI